MSTTATHPFAVDYLRRLRAAGRQLPADRLEDLCAEVESHLAEAIPPGASDTDALEVIERLGPPGEIIDAEQPPSEVRTDSVQRSWREWAAVILLPLGGFAVVIGWVIGVVLLWSSRAWTTRDKVIGTLILPGGIASFIWLTFLAGAPQTNRCFSRPGYQRCTVTNMGTGHDLLNVLLIVFAVIAPLITAYYLARRAGLTLRRS